MQDTIGLFNDEEKPATGVSEACADKVFIRSHRAVSEAKADITTSPYGVGVAVHVGGLALRRWFWVSRV